jgi:hypothetical protein
MIKPSDMYEVVDVETVTLCELIDEYVKEGDKFIVKIDIEAQEQFLWTNRSEFEALKKADYISAELHFFSLNGETNIIIKEKIEEALVELALTHNIEFNNLNIYCTKK